MSMREYPCSGYVVSASQFADRLPKDKLSKYLDALNDGDRETVEQILSECLSHQLPPFTVFCPRDTDTVDEPMEVGMTYVIFDEDDLYIKSPTPALVNLQAVGLQPQFCQWCVWG